MKHLLSIWFILGVLLTATAQTTPCFEAFDAASGAKITTLCVGQEVLFQDCGNKADDDKEYYVFDYRGESPIPTPPTPNKRHTYTQPGRYRVLQIANYGSNTSTDTLSKVYEVRAAPEPSFTYTSCANSAVSFTVTGTEYDSYTFDFGDGETGTVAPGGTTTHRYAAQNTYTVTLTGSTAGSLCSSTATQAVTTLPPLDPASPTQLERLTVLEQGPSGSILLELSGLVPGYSYVVEKYTGNFRAPFEEVDVIQEVAGSSLTHTVRNVDTSEGSWFLVRPVDACGAVFINTNIVSALSLQVQANETEVNLKWDYQPDFEQFEVYRNGSLLQTLPGNVSSFADTDVTCNQSYEYSVIGTGTDPQGDSYASVSASESIEVISTEVPAAPYLLSSFNLDNQVELTLQLPEGQQLGIVALERSLNGRNYESLALSQETVYTDNSIRPQPVCYRASFTNACGVASPLGNVSCPIILEAERQTDGSVTLTWSAYTGFPGSVGQYTVELLDGDGNVVNSYPATGLTYTDRTLSNDLPLLRYRIRATAQNGTGVTYSNLEEVEQDVLVFIPSAFTPNGDGLNDTFEIKGKFFNGYTLRVYNRLGSVIYEGTETDPAWDGTQNGREVAAGAYAYELTLQSEFGTAKRKTGTITLLR